MVHRPLVRSMCVVTFTPPASPGDRRGSCSTFGLCIRLGRNIPPNEPVFRYSRTGRDGVRITPSGGEEVGDGGASAEDGNVRDEPAVAAPPEALAAHQRNAVLARGREHVGHGGPEIGGTGVRCVGAERRYGPPGVDFGCVCWSVPPAAEPLLPPVGNAEGRQPLLERLAADIGVGPAAREATYIHHQADTGAPQQRAQRGAVQGTVPDGDEVRHGSSHCGLRDNELLHVAQMERLCSAREEDP